MADLSVLKKAFADGHEAFKAVVVNDKGVYNNPPNPYTKNSLPWKEWERGYNWGYYEAKKVAQ